MDMISAPVTSTLRPLRFGYFSRSNPIGRGSTDEIRASRQTSPVTVSLGWPLSLTESRQDLSGDLQLTLSQKGAVFGSGDRHRRGSETLAVISEREAEHGRKMSRLDFMLSPIMPRAVRHTMHEGVAGAHLANTAILQFCEYLRELHACKTRLGNDLWLENEILHILMERVQRFMLRR